MTEPVVNPDLRAYSEELNKLTSALNKVHTHYAEDARVIGQAIGAIHVLRGFITSNEANKQK